ncbi:hypothetical protein [Mesorhizobium sp. CN2-181]|uniref:hypothetical protein n=1 Tax=Mesorhizobium yinganensis TaxID=3157707 RepID=UPI0032B775A2
MKKDEAEKAIRHMCALWAGECNIPIDPMIPPSFSDFKTWAEKKGYGQYFEFRSIMGARHDVEQWFDEEFKQTWRN